ncbi:hypothetical protein VHUM_00950 [Vanrija humicola]|uniref:Intradiol ring-cleavage dioxygenases domain-containing protein n=1 Tax=Vanrija humicola TaxID=5417 RepID=A0A7D8V2K4_VANHU|nr:hypothetical protein VHUM_00950 [Vanrija humicola]
MKLLPLLLLAVPLATAHPGEDHAHEAAERAAHLAAIGRRSLSHCAPALHARAAAQANAARRAALLARHRAARRDLAAVLGTSHRSNLTGVTADTNSSVLFGSENSCILAPEVTEGPYYVTGELVRSDITESQPGVPLHLDIQVIDTNTCAPAPGIALDLWHCNASGVYSGVVARGNGNSADAANADATFLRGVQATGSDGVAQFSTIVPGHYTGRAAHIHVLAHAAGHWAAQANGTISGGASAAHVGQVFFDQDLLDSVYALPPYNANTGPLTANADDGIMAQEAAGVDPVVAYALLGDTVADGIVAWITVGINGTANAAVQPAMTLEAGSGVAVSGGGRGGGGGGGPPGGAGPGAGSSGAAGASATATGSTSASAATGTTGTCRPRLLSDTR